MSEPEKSDLNIYVLSLATEGTGSAPISMREPTHDFFLSLAGLHQAAFATMDEDGWSASSIEDLYNHEGVNFFVAVKGDEVQAFAIVRAVSGEAELLTIVTNPLEQNTGLGLAVLNRVYADLLRRKVDRMFLEVRSDNASALHLYRKTGFQNMGVRKNYYKTRTGDFIDACTLVKKLR